MKNKITSAKNVIGRSKVRRPMRKYVLGTPLKSLAKTQAALFGVVFISTILLSSLLTFAQTNDSINETIDQLVQTLTGDSNSSDNSSEANISDATADIILPPDNSTQENTTIGYENITIGSTNITNETTSDTNVSSGNTTNENATVLQNISLDNLTAQENLTALQNLTNFTTLDNFTQSTNLTNTTIGDGNTTLLKAVKKSKKLITKFNNKLKVRGKGKPQHNADIAVFGEDDNSTKFEVHVNLADTKRVKRIKINDANLDDNT